MGRAATTRQSELRTYPDDAVIVDLPGIKVRSLNDKPWSAGAARGAAAGRRKLRETALICVRAHLHELPKSTYGRYPHSPFRTPHLHGPLHVTIQRISPRKLDDDNLVGACKALRDGVADAFELRDDHDLLSWSCEQAQASLVSVKWAVGIRIVLTPLGHKDARTHGGSNG